MNLNKSISKTRFKTIMSILQTNSKKIKSITSDMIINIFATALPVFVLQFILLPIVAKKYDESRYGLMLTLISLITLSVQPFSISLSNSRLLMNQKYKESGIKGDFNVLLLSYNLINIAILTIVTYLYEGYFNIINILLIIIISVIQLIRRYLSVSFRLNINYKGILCANIILILGYIVGMLLFLLTKTWQFIYLVGEFASLLYIINNSKLLKEPFEITHLFRNTTQHGLIILGASFLGTANSQIDKLLLYPILGAKMVTIYYVSTLFGKTISMLVGPINNVILTYLSKMKRFEFDSFILLIFTGSTFGVFGYILILCVSEPILRLLYPLYVDEAMKLIYITTLTAIIMMLCTLINPVIMRFCSINWQIWINIINIVVYTILAFKLVDLYGIYGFCFAALIASFIKLTLMIFIYLKNRFTISNIE